MNSLFDEVGCYDFVEHLDSDVLNTISELYNGESEIVFTLISFLGDGFTGSFKEVTKNLLTLDKFKDKENLLITCIAFTQNHTYVDGPNQHIEFITKLDQLYDESYIHKADFIGQMYSILTVRLMYLIENTMSVMNQDTMFAVCVFLPVLNAETPFLEKVLPAVQDWLAIHHPNVYVVSVNIADFNKNKLAN